MARRGLAEKGRKTPPKVASAKRETQGMGSLPICVASLGRRFCTASGMDSGGSICVMICVALDELLLSSGTK